MDVKAGSPTLSGERILKGADSNHVDTKIKDKGAVDGVQKPVNPKDPSRPRRKKARRACFACQRAHLTCGMWSSLVALFDLVY